MADDFQDGAQAAADVWHGDLADVDLEWGEVRRLVLLCF